MTASYFALSSDSYKQIIFSGLTRLQEQQEFVDLTLAADGHIAKVHKNVMALASPYIKEILKSTTSDNPVIFLNNVKYNVLIYLLEYIYQGQVNLPQDCIEPFFQLSQSLCIIGMGKPNTSKNDFQTDHANQNLGASITLQQVQKQPTITLDGTCNESTRKVAAHITINKDHNVEVQQYKNIQISNAEGNDSNLNSGQVITLADAIHAMPIIETFENGVEDPGNMEIDVTLPQGDHTNAIIEKEQTSQLRTISILSDYPVDTEDSNLINLNVPMNMDQETRDALKVISQYSITERGSVQIIVSRYIYCCHHASRGGRKQRWRCADYRKKQCPAHIDSLDGRIILRKGLHNHGFHDDVIYKKHEKCNIFNTYQQARDAWLPSKKCSDFENKD